MHTHHDSQWEPEANSVMKGGQIVENDKQISFSAHGVFFLFFFFSFKSKLCMLSALWLGRMRCERWFIILFTKCCRTFHFWRLIFFYLHTFCIFIYTYIWRADISRVLHSKDYEFYQIPQCCLIKRFQQQIQKNNNNQPLLEYGNPNIQQNSPTAVVSSLHTTHTVNSRVDTFPYGLRRWRRRRLPVVLATVGKTNMIRGRNRETEVYRWYIHIFYAVFMLLLCIYLYLDL